MSDQGTETARGSRPKAVDTAFLFTLAAIVLGAIGTAVTMLLDHEEVVRLVRETLSGSGQPYTEDDVVGLIGAFRVAGGILIALVAGLLVLVAVFLRAGRNWARLVVTAFALFGMVNFLAAVSASGAALDLMWSLAGVACAVTAVVYLFRPESTKFFANRRKRG